MAVSITRSRALSLRSPMSNESERAHFQRRLTFTLKAVFLLASGFFVLQLVTLAFSDPSQIPRLFGHRSVQIQLGTTLVALVAALLLGRGKPSARVLDTAEGVLTVAICTGWAALIAAEHRTFPRGDLIALLATGYTLSIRAALIPSPPGRSAIVGLLAMTPILPLAFFVYQGGVGPEPLGIDNVAYAAIWALVGVACTTTISYVIYGLRLQVHRAMQLGQYQLEDKIGEGGMGVVYRARHAMLRRPTAIKLLTASTEHAVERFEREVQVTARLTHPNTIAIYDYGRTPERTFYYAMEYLEGVALNELVDEFGPQPIPRVVHILLQICGALEEAHAAGLVHRDIKPANVMLTERGGVPDVVKVLDFGLAREIEHVDVTVSSTNLLVGTPHFLAPEAIIDPEHVDGRADLYALGATAHFLLTGTCVFESANVVELCSQHLHQPPTGPRAKRPDVPEALDRVVLACLAKKREDRPDDAGVLADRLRACGVQEWTRADARAWWYRVKESARFKGASSRAAAETAGFESATVTVAFDHRAVS